MSEQTWIKLYVGVTFIQVSFDGKNLYTFA